MTTAPLQPMFLIIELFATIQLTRFWWTLHRRGYFGLCFQTYTVAFLADVTALLLFASQLAYAVKGLLGTPETAIPVMVFGAFMALVMVNCRGRLEHDSATRTIAALNSIYRPASRIHP